MLRMRSREPSPHSATTTFLRCACSASTWATTASKTFTELSLRSGAKLRPCRERQGRSFAPERNDSSVNVFEAVVAHVLALQAQRKKVVVALWGEGSRDRMRSMLSDHKLVHLTS